MKKIISYVLVFFLSLFICLSFTLNVLKSEVFEYNNIISKLEKSNYYNKAYISVNNHFENIIEQSGLDKSVLENIVSNEKIKQDVNDSIKSIFEGKEYKVDISLVEENLDKNISEYLKQNNRIPNNKEKETIKEFERKIALIYEEDIFPNSIFGKFSKVFVKVKDLLSKIIPIVYICALVLVILITTINIKRISSIINYFGICLISSGVLLIIPKIIEVYKLELNKLNIINVNISSFVSTVILDVLYKLMYFAIFAIILGVIITVISNIFYYAKTRNKNIN